MSKHVFEVLLKNTVFTCHLDLKHRKNLNIRIKPNNVINISKPRLFTIDKVKAYLIDNEASIVSKAFSINEVYDNRNSYMTDEYVVVFDKKYYFNEHDGILDNLDDIFFEYINFRKEYYDKLLNQNPTIELKNLRGKWGTCAPTLNHIVLNRKLIHYPKACIDYVILHEYAHLLVPNHSKAFYDVLQKHMPNYKEYINYLKNY